MKQRPYSCGLEAALDVVNGKWKPLILRSLRRRPCRFGELRRAVVGVSEKMLIQNLRELEADGVISRTDFHEVPPRVEYSLTPFGGTLMEALISLGQWGKTYIRDIERLKEREPADRPDGDGVGFPTRVVRGRRPPDVGGGGRRWTGSRCVAGELRQIHHIVY